MYTPRFAGRRVRIPDHCVEMSGSRAVIVPGEYPQVENGQPVTATTPVVALGGAYRVRRASCGLGCRCDATITPIVAAGRS